MRILEALLLGATVLSAACGRGAPPPAPADEARMSDQPSDSLRLSVEIPAHSAREPVTISLEVKNVADRALELYLRGREPVADVRIRDASGAVVWHNLEKVAVPAILQLRTLAPGEALRMEVRWERGGAPGHYTVEAGLLTELASLAFPSANFELE